MRSIQKEIRAYFSDIGRKGGAKSRRCLSREDARKMVKIREAKKIFKQYHGQCFWYMKPDLKVTLQDIPEIVSGLRKNGGRQGFFIAEKLCQ